MNFRRAQTELRCSVLFYIVICKRHDRNAHHPANTRNCRKKLIHRTCMAVAILHRLNLYFFRFYKIFRYYTSTATFLFCPYTHVTCVFMSECKLYDVMCLCNTISMEILAANSRSDNENGVSSTHVSTISFNTRHIQWNIYKMRANFASLIHSWK